MSFPLGRSVPLLAIAVGILGCSDAIGESFENPLTPTAPAGSGITLHITAPTALVVGEEVVVRLDTRDASGRLLNNTPVMWTSLSPQTLEVTANESPVGRVKGVSAGVATVTATTEGKTQTIQLTVSPLPGSSGAILVVESFTVIEFQYPSQPNHWHYAPLVRVRETGAGGAVAITGYDFIIPGLGRSPACATYRRVDRGATLDLFREVYGDYGFTIAQAGARATGAPATALITIRDGNGPETTLTVTGPIVSGSLPTTYTGGTVDWRCN